MEGGRLSEDAGEMDGVWGTECGGDRVVHTVERTLYWA